MSFTEISVAATAGNANGDVAITGWGKLLYARVILTTDATVADRRLIIQVLNESGSSVMDIHAGAVVAASATTQHHECLPGIYRETSFTGGSLEVPIPDQCMLLNDWTLRFYIENGVAGDSFTVTGLMETP